MKKLVVSFVFLSLISASDVQSSAVLDYGFGSRASVTGAEQSRIQYPDVYSLILNPSQLGRIQESFVSFGFMGTYGSFNPIENVLLKNKDQDKKPEPGNVSTDYPETIGGVFAMAIPLRKKFPKIAAGFGGFLPLGSLTTIKLSSMYYTPTYPMYDNRSQRASLLGSVGVELFPGFLIGGGANFYMTSSAETYIDLNTINAGQSLSMEVKSNFSPLLGMTYEAEKFSVTFNYRGASDYKTSVHSIADMNTVLDGEEVSLPMPLSLAGSAFYDPAEIELGFAMPLFGNISLSSSLTWKMWSRNKKPLGEFKAPVDSTVEQLKYKDSKVIRIGFEYAAKPYALRGGYIYQPTHIPDQTNSNLNIVDSNKHIFSLGAGYNIDSLLGIVTRPMSLDFHMQYHALEEKEMTKSDPSLIGSGGYTAGGSVMTYGLSVTMKL